MIKLINDLLDVTKIEEQKFKYKFAQADMREVINNVIQGLNTLAIEKKVTVTTSFNPNKPLLVEVDREKIELAISNLIDNAIKYSKTDGKVEVSVTLQDSTIEGYVKDHGLGIPKNSQPEVFSKFFRGPNILTVVTEGSGLGLFIVKDIIAKHDGNISFSSTENSGTTFYWSLPLTQAAMPEPLTSTVAPA
jgi:signal transduction histidine kinase